MTVGCSQLKNFSVITNLLGGLTSLPLTLVLPPLLYIKLMLMSGVDTALIDPAVDDSDGSDRLPDPPMSPQPHPAVQTFLQDRQEDESSRMASENNSVVGSDSESPDHPEDIRSRTIGYGDAIKMAEAFNRILAHRDAESTVHSDTEEDDMCINDAASCAASSVFPDDAPESSTHPRAFVEEVTLWSLWAPMLVCAIGVVVTLTTITYTIMDIINPDDPEPLGCAA